MGFLDFLHGSAPRKSEAELYMEKRNKEYAKKAAEYKRKEALADIAERFGANVNCQKTSRRVDTQSPTNLLETIANSIAKEFGVPLTNVSKQQKPGNYSTMNTNGMARKSESVREYHREVIRDTCDDCWTDSEYDNDETAVFVVKNASIKAATRTLTAIGNITRGRFEVGDAVQVVSSSGTQNAIIASIIRQGEKIQYANVSSGPIGLVFANITDMMVRSGDKIVKAKTKYFQ